MAAPIPLPLAPLGIPAVFPPPLSMLAFAVSALAVMARMGRIDLLRSSQERDGDPDDGQQGQPAHHPPARLALPDIPS
jgi:hypothetical protein